jgi:uroporphyrin-3 C-methyltransferase
MANNDEKQQIDANVKDAELNEKPTPGSADNRLLWIAIATLLVLLIAAGAWFYQQLKAQQQQQTDAHTALQSEMATLADADDDTRQRLGTLQQDQQGLADKIEQLLNRETLSSADLKRTWALQEIKYLLNVANQRALLAHDVAGALQALQMADSQIKALTDYRLHPLRALIAEEIMALESLADVDTAGIALKLQTAANTISTLRVKKGPEVSAAQATGETGDLSGQAGWKQAAADIWQQLRSLVVIRHDQSGEAAVLVPEQRYFLYQNLRLQLESARLALLNADKAAYQHSLQTAIKWLKHYFTGDQRDALLATLESLNASQIKVDVPDISGSLSWLEEYQQ